MFEVRHCPSLASSVCAWNRLFVAWVRKLCDAVAQLYYKRTQSHNAPVQEDIIHRWSHFRLSLYISTFRFQVLRLNSRYYFCMQSVWHVQHLLADFSFRTVYFAQGGMVQASLVLKASDVSQSVQ